MPHYFFHLRTADGLERDDDGITFPSLDEAKADALACLFEMGSDKLSAGQQNNLLGMEITDDHGTVLASVETESQDRHVDPKDSNEGHAFIHGRGGKENP